MQNDPKTAKENNGVVEVRKTGGFAGVTVSRCKAGEPRKRLSSFEARLYGTRRCLPWEKEHIADISCKKYPGFGFAPKLREFIKTKKQR